VLSARSRSGVQLASPEKLHDEQNQIRHQPADVDVRCLNAGQARRSCDER
jgi:hypothetical protein